MDDLQFSLVSYARSQSQPERHVDCISAAREGQQNMTEELARRARAEADLRATSDMLSTIAARREAQKAENERIQQEGIKIKPLVMTLDQMIENYAWIAEGEMVADLANPHTVMRWPEFRSLTCSLRTVVGDQRDQNRAPKPMPTAVLWQQSSERLTVTARTWRAGAAKFCDDPEGRSAFNAWRAIPRTEASADISPFLMNIAYLFPDDVERKRFLDWLAHIEQRPGELPHFGWLHVADNTGTGRNWLASLLARVWRGQVAPNIDLAALLDSQFNDELGGRVLAIVDEVQEAAGERRHTHVNRLKSLVNAERRTINPKFGRKYDQFNACRWLVFSNHVNAIPIDDNDRRWFVVHQKATPRKAEDYVTLYAMLSDSSFVNAVGVYLSNRDISGFNPGERPALNAAKAAVIGAGKSIVRQRVDEVMADWPADVITNRDLLHILTDGSEDRFTAAMRRALEEVGAIAIPKAVRIGTEICRLWVLRNHPKWLSASSGELGAAVRSARDGHIGETSSSEVLAGFTTESSRSTF